MGDFFDTMTIVVVIIMVFIVLVIAIHASARLIQMTFGRKSGLKQKDTAKSNEAVKNAEPVNLPEQNQIHAFGHRPQSYHVRLHQ